VAKNNTITNLIIGRRYHFGMIKFLVNLCPQVKYFAIDYGSSISAW